MRIGIDLGGTKIEGVVLGPDNTVLVRQRLPTPAGDYRGTIDAIASLVDSLAGDVGAPPHLPVGVSMPGSISRATGFIKNANSTCLNGQPFDRDLEARLERRVRVANDANCFALSEASDGAGQGFQTVFGVILGTGVGGGVVVGGRILDGPNGIAGEWGHNPLPWPNPEETAGMPCYCGKAGCIETWISGPAFERWSMDVRGTRLPAADIATAAQSGEACAQAALELLGQRIGKSLALVTNVIDPDVIVLGGGLSNIEALYAVIPQALSRYAFSDAITTPVVRAAHGDSSGVRGAAWLWDRD